jgi:hypothetical protein
MTIELMRKLTAVVKEFNEMIAAGYATVSLRS